MKRKLLLIFCSLVLFAASGCNRLKQEPGSTPDYRIADLQNISTEEERRFELKIVLPSHYTEDEVKATLASISNTVNESDSEIVMNFYGPYSDLRKSFDIAQVIWKEGISRFRYVAPAGSRNSE